MPPRRGTGTQKGILHRSKLMQNARQSSVGKGLAQPSEASSTAPKKLRILRSNVQDEAGVPPQQPHSEHTSSVFDEFDKYVRKV